MAIGLLYFGRQLGLWVSGFKPVVLMFLMSLRIVSFFAPLPLVSVRSAPTFRVLAVVV